jgi:hypothetical protein
LALSLSPAYGWLVMFATWDEQDGVSRLVIKSLSRSLDTSHSDGGAAVAASTSPTRGPT